MKFLKAAGYVQAWRRADSALEAAAQVVARAEADRRALWQVFFFQKKKDNKL